MKRPISIASDHISDDTVEALEFLLYMARRGEVHGVVYVAQLKQRKYIMDTAGEAHGNPISSLGMVHLLADELIRRARGLEGV